MQEILSDNHIHPFEKMKSKSGMRQFVERATELGLKELVFTEHAPHVPGLCAHGMTEDELEAYVAYTRELQSETSALSVKLGIELDWHNENAAYIKDLLKNYKFDYILGSIHIHSTVYEKDIQNMELFEIGNLALKQTMEAIESKLFDAIAHLDFFRWLSDKNRFGRDFTDYRPKDHFEILKKIFKQMETYGTFLEINSSGLYKNFKSILPSPEILQLADNYNLNYVYGSDAHMPELVGSGRKEVIDALSQKQIASLRNKN